MIRAEEYPIPSIRLYPAKFINILKLCLISCIVMSIDPFAWFNISTPSAFLWAVQNKVYSSLMLFFLVAVLEGQLMSTGAFEIYFNDMPIWSKLESGRIPSPSEIFEMINSQLKLYTMNKSATFKDDLTL